MLISVQASPLTQSAYEETLFPGVGHFAYMISRAVVSQEHLLLRVGLHFSVYKRHYQTSNFLIVCTILSRTQSMT